jgi:uncharacterized membrane protein (GlpM family)
VGFALAYRLVARDRWLIPFVAGSAVYVLTTIGLDHVHWTAWPTFGMVMAVIGAGYAVIRLRRGASRTGADTMKPRRWDIPARMAVATTVVLVITGLAPAMGPHLAGLLSPFPVFGIVLALFTHRSQGTAGAIAVLGGLVMGLATPAVFFLALALALPHMGLAAFGIATLAALLVQGSTVFLVPSRPVAASAPS